MRCSDVKEPVTTPWPWDLLSLSRALMRVERPFTDTEQKPKFCAALQRRPTAATVAVDRTIVGFLCVLGVGNF